MREEQKRKAAARRRRERARKQRTRRIVLTVALVLVVALASIGGTLAWLVDSTNPVVNTFTPSNIGVTLTETGTTTKDNAETKSYQMIPGTTKSKDPKVTITNDVDAYLFVEVNGQDWMVSNSDGTKTYKLTDFLSYELTLSTGWTQGTGTGEGGNGVPTNVWYREVAEDATTKTWNLLKDNQVAYKGTITKEMMALVTANNYPTLTFKAYAAQKEGFANVGAAWQAAK